MKPTFKEKQKTCHKRAKVLKESATPSEVLFKQRLLDANIPFMFQKGFIQGNFYCIVDFYLPKPYKTVIEIDGGYHTTPLQIFKDTQRYRYLTEKRNLRVIRIKNEDVLTFDLNTL